jgi:hypothetical protein
MRFTEFLAELRRQEKEKSPEPKYTELGHPAAIEYLKGRDLSKYAITMTNLPKVGVNPRSTYKTPLGIYFYPAEYYVDVQGRVPFQADAKYINILQLTTNKILYLNQMSTNSINAALNKLKQLPITGLDLNGVINELINDAQGGARVRTKSGKFWYVLWKLSDEISMHTLHTKYSGTSVVWNYLFRQMGYDVVIDQGRGIIHQQEPTQGFIANPRGTYRLEKTINNIGTYELSTKQLAHQASQSSNSKEAVHLALVTQNPYVIGKIKNPSEQVQLAAVQGNGRAIEYIKNPSEQVQLAAVQQHGKAIELIKNPSEQVQLAAVRRNGLAIRYIKNPSEQVQLAAVQKDGDAIIYINDPSEALQLAAVQQNGTAIRHIKNPSEQVQLAAVQRNGWVIQYIKNPSEQVQLAAVQQYWMSIRDIKNPSEQVQLAAVQQNGLAIRLIKNPSEAVKAAAKNQK